MALELPAISTEYMYVNNITAFDSRSPDALVDPTTLPAQMALAAQNTSPSSADWKSATWVDTTTIRILTGTSGTLTPTAGTYGIWLRVTGATEQPEERIGTLLVT